MHLVSISAGSLESRKKPHIQAESIYRVLFLKPCLLWHVQRAPGVSGDTFFCYLLSRRRIIKNVLALTLGPAEFFMFACLGWHLNFLRNVCVRPQPPPSRLCPLLQSPGIKDGCKCLIDGWEYLGAKECSMSKIDAQAEWLISEGKILSCRPPGFPTLSGLLQGRRSSHLLLENYLKTVSGTCRMKTPAHSGFPLWLFTLILLSSFWRDWIESIARHSRRNVS